jgi:hypothetical protein
MPPVKEIASEYYLYTSTLRENKFINETKYKYKPIINPKKISPYK